MSRKHNSWMGSIPWIGKYFREQGPAVLPDDDGIFRKFRDDEKGITIKDNLRQPPSARSKLDDLFGDSSPAPKPKEPDFTEEAKSRLDDLFGEPDPKPLPSKEDILGDLQTITDIHELEEACSRHPFLGLVKSRLYKRRELGKVVKRLDFMKDKTPSSYELLTYLFTKARAEGASQFGEQMISGLGKNFSDGRKLFDSVSQEAKNEEHWDVEVLAKSSYGRPISVSGQFIGYLEAAVKYALFRERKEASKKERKRLLKIHTEALVRVIEMHNLRLSRQQIEKLFLNADLYEAFEKAPGCITNSADKTLYGQIIAGVHNAVKEAWSTERKEMKEKASEMSYESLQFRMRARDNHQTIKDWRKRFYIWTSIFGGTTAIAAFGYYNAVGLDSLRSASLKEILMGAAAGVGGAAAGVIASRTVPWTLEKLVLPVAMVAYTIAEYPLELAAAKASQKYTDISARIGTYLFNLTPGLRKRRAEKLFKPRLMPTVTMKHHKKIRMVGSWNMPDNCVKYTPYYVRIPFEPPI